jgi:DNA-binding beta-propeller fold protein YncE
MMQRRIAWSVGLVAIAVVMAITRTAGQDGPYRFLREIPIGGDQKTFWDYASLDSAARRLYVTANTRVVVIDVDTNKIVGETKDTDWVHGFALAPELGRGFTSNGKWNTSTIVDLKTLNTIAQVKTGGNPDAILYEPGRKEVYALNGLGKSATIFNALSGEVIKTIPFPATPETGQAEPKVGRVYVNIYPKNQIAVIDTATHEIVDMWPTAPCETPFSMAIDTVTRRIFVGCHNRMVVVMDTATGKVLSQAPIGPRVDAVVYDPGTNFVISTNGDETGTVMRREGTDALKVIQTFKTPLFSRTMALDLKTHNIYLAAGRWDVPNPTWETVMPVGKLVPGTFRVVVYGMGPSPASSK